ncbi:hypothetical protein BU24DRAFT_476238 [Aaosphaeria arxii CBS 175.79]|uniref:Cupin type-1 domain-containing protein n=1 Tax=Aaosphaeria arxii CBS 175.79 TaxID=1450172 RepID=A0A6A5Y142_9PLEO|nr:uncharacterized protein BU24DRAFT_476238 [Aaosphaeria arxii CBS 175.79]KAF2019192.1 hypothetical protein BU24DRAFT_476238 [Aaosphaeria arxii CBS 175.79]
MKALAAALVVGTVQALPQSGAPTPVPSASPVPMTPLPNNDDLLAKLKTDSSAIKRYQRLLTNNGEELLGQEDLAKATVLDFQATRIPVVGSQGGSNSPAFPGNLPILLDSGLNINFATLGPCGLFLPHVHPRANEFFVVVEGEVDFGYMLEIGLLNPPAPNPNPEITGKLTKHKGTVFPQGSVHWQINDSEDCTSTAVYTFLSSDDPGSTAILQSPAGGNGTMRKRLVDMEEVDDVRPLLPPQLADTVTKCLARCKKN